MRWPEPKKRIRKHIGMGTVIAMVSSACLLFALCSNRATVIYVGAFLAFVAFNLSLRGDAKTEFSWGITGFFILLVILCIQLLPLH